MRVGSMRTLRGTLALALVVGAGAVPAVAKPPGKRAAPSTAAVTRQVAAHFDALGGFSGPWACRALGRATWRCSGTAFGAQAAAACESLLPCGVLVTVTWTRGQLHFTRPHAG